MKTSFLHEYLGKVVPLLIVVFAVLALRLDSTSLSIAVLLLSALALHVWRVEYIARREDLLSELTEMLDGRDATGMDRIMFELWLIRGSSELGFIPRCAVSGIAGVLLGALALANSLAAAQ